MENDLGLEHGLDLTNGPVSRSTTRGPASVFSRLSRAQFVPQASRSVSERAKEEREEREEKKKKKKKEKKKKIQSESARKGPEDKGDGSPKSRPRD